MSFRAGKKEEAVAVDPCRVAQVMSIPLDAIAEQRQAQAPSPEGADKEDGDVPGFPYAAEYLAGKNVSTAHTAEDNFMT